MSDKPDKQPFEQAFNKAAGDQSRLSDRAKGLIAIGVAAIYFLVPTDVIPDVIAGVGWIDDAVIFALGTWFTLSKFLGPKK